MKRRGKRFYLFVRVSTRGQEDGQSRTVQRKLGQEYVKRNGGEVAGVIEGVESATKSAEDRAMLQRLLRDASAGKFDALWALDQSRLTRAPDTLQLIIETFRLHNLELHFQGGKVTFDTPEGEFQAGMQSQGDRYFAQKITQRTLQSRLEYLAQGRHALGRPPWGRRWNKTSQRWEIDEKKHAQLLNAYRLYVQKGESLTNVAKKTDFKKSTLTKVFDSAGATTKKVSLATPTGVATFALTIPPLLTPRQSAAIARRKALNATVRPGTKSRWMLQGVIRCWHCGGSLSGTPSKKGNKVYDLYRHLPENRGPQCLWHVPARLLEDDVVHACAQVLLNDRALLSAIKAAMAKATEAGEEVGQQIGDLQRLQETRRKRLDRLRTELLELDGSEAACSDFRKEIRKISDAVAETEVELRDLNARVAMLRTSDMKPSEVAERLRAITGLRGFASLAMLTPEQKRQLVILMIGRDKRESPHGLFVKRRRVPGSTRDLVWDWEMRGALAFGEGTTTDFAELAIPAKATGRKIDEAAITKLARLTREVSPLRCKSCPLCSSGGSRRCA